MESFFTFLICLLFLKKKKKSRKGSHCIIYLKNCNQVLGGDLTVVNFQSDMKVGNFQSWVSLVRRGKFQ